MRFFISFLNVAVLEFAGVLSVESCTLHDFFGRIRCFPGMMHMAVYTDTVF
jgi:hypothetical protein